jgi:hypothetical protein
MHEKPYGEGIKIHHRLYTGTETTI